MAVDGVSCGQIEVCTIRCSTLLSLFCPCRKRQHSVHAGSVWLSGFSTELQVAGQPQVQRVSGQHQHWTQPCAHSQLGAPDQQRFNPQPVCLPGDAALTINPDQNPVPTTHRESWHHLWIFVLKRVKLSRSWKDPFGLDLLVLSLLLALSARLFSPTTTFYLWIIQNHAIPLQTPVRPFFQSIHLFP